jgi:hypothetical protein
MRNLITVFFLFLFSFVANAQFYYGAGKAVNIENDIGYLKNTQLIKAGYVADPQTSSPVGGAGSLLMKTDGTLYAKKDAGATANWKKIFDESTNLIPYIATASSTQTGLLTSGDWTIFNNKQSTIEKGAANGYASLDALGLIPITQIPPSVIERLVIVADQTARFALTTGTVQNGDTVKQVDIDQMFYIVDDTNLGNAAGYVTYAAGNAATVPWSGITGMVTSSATLTGVLSSTDWSRFNAKENVLTFSSPLSRVGNAISIPSATTATSGYLESADWATFNNKITTPPTCTLDQVISFNGTSYICRDSAISAGAGARYFMIDTLSGVGSYLTLSKTASTTTEEADSITIVANNTDTQYAGLGYADGPIGSTSIDAGMWEFNVWRYVDSTAGTTELKFKVYSRTTGGVETLLFEVTTGDINDTVPTLQIIRTTQPSFVVAATDILVIKTFGRTTAAAKIVTYLHNGTSRNSNILSPISTKHNQLAGLQGGATNEYYHMTANQNSAVATLSATSTWVRSTADLTIDVNKYFYFGDPLTNGSFRTYQSSGSLITEKREVGVWVEAYRQE